MSNPDARLSDDYRLNQLIDRLDRAQQKEQTRGVSFKHTREDVDQLLDTLAEDLDLLATRHPSYAEAKVIVAELRFALRMADDQHHPAELQYRPK